MPLNVCLLNVHAMFGMPGICHGRKAAEAAAAVTGWDTPGSGTEVAMGPGMVKPRITYGRLGISRSDRSLVGLTPASQKLKFTYQS